MTIKSTQDVYVPRSSSSDSALYECIATNYPGNIKEQRKTSIDFRGIYTYVVHICNIIILTLCNEYKILLTFCSLTEIYLLHNYSSEFRVIITVKSKTFY